MVRILPTHKDAASNLGRFSYLWFALAGALLTRVAVFGLASMGRRTLSPAFLVLGGAAVAAFLS